MVRLPTKGQWILKVGAVESLVSHSLVSHRCPQVLADESQIEVTWEALLVHDKYKGGHSEPAIELSTGSPMGELEKGPKELKGFAAPQEEQQYDSSSTHRAPRDKIINQRVHMELPMAPDA